MTLFNGIKAKAPELFEVSEDDVGKVEVVKFTKSWNRYMKRFQTPRICCFFDNLAVNSFMYSFCGQIFELAANLEARFS